MKPSKILALLALVFFAGAFLAATTTYRVVQTYQDGTLFAPTNFFLINSNLLKAAVSGNNSALCTNGVDGLNGTNGAPGPIGPQGVPGTNGVSGTNGLDGAKGANGLDGTNGAPGLNGTDGLNGAQGPQGPAGTNAAVGLVTNIWTTNTSGTVPGSSINSAVSNATVSSYVSGTLSNSITGSAASIVPSVHGVTVTGTNVVVDLSIGNAFSFTLTTNAYIIATNSSAMRWGMVEVIQGSVLTNLVSFNTNYTAPPIYGQTLTMPTNTAQSRQFVYIQGRATGNTNNFWQTLVP